MTNEAKWQKTAVPACGTRRRIPMTTALQGLSMGTTAKDWITVTNHSNARIKTGYSYSGKPGFEAIAEDGITSGKALPTAKNTLLKNMCTSDANRDQQSNDQHQHSKLTNPYKYISLKKRGKL